MLPRVCGRPLAPVPPGARWLEAEGFLLVARTRAFAGHSPTQRQLIEQATAASLANVSEYSQALLKESLAALDQASTSIQASLLSLGDLSQFTRSQLPGKTVELARLKALNASVERAGARLKKDLRLVHQGVTADMATQGIQGVLGQLGALQLPGYKDLALVEQAEIAAGAFSLVNVQAFDFLAGYQLQLLGKLSDDLVAGVKQAVSVGLVQGHGPAKIARAIGGVVTDPAEFRKAGKTVFRTVQQRAELIARSETMRAYNQGALKFEQRIGVKRLTWLTAGDERTCPECGPLDGREFALEKLPGQPLHPACRCTHVAAAGGLDQIQDLPALQAEISKHALGQQVVKDAQKTGDFGKLTVVQLRELAKSKGISIGRTKAERLAILADSSGIDLVDLEAASANDLHKLFLQYKVGALKVRDELVQALLGADTAKDAAKIAAQQAAIQAAKDAADKAKKAAQLAAQQAQAAQAASSQFHLNLAAMQEVADPATFLQYGAARDKAIAHLAGALDVLGAEQKKLLAATLNDAMAAFAAKVNAAPQKALREILKASKVKNFQWFTKGETVEYILVPQNRKTLAEQMAAKVAAAKLAKAPKVTAPKPAAPAPAAPLPAPKPALVLAKEADEAWAAVDKGAFVFDGDAKSLGGAHTKYFFKDPDGQRWLFKPIDEEFRAWGDEVAYRIHREIDPEAVEARFIELTVKGRKRKGSIQRMRTGLRKPADYAGMDLSQLPQEELLQLQREHVVDWLISNHDGHAAQFLRAESGHVFGIDKGQLFKHLGSDRLAIDYYPNERFGAGEPIYNTLLRLHRDGKLALDLQATEEFIRRTEWITDAAYREMLGPYADRRFPGQPGARADFLTLAVKRKNGLRADFEEFYSEIESARTGRKVSFRFDGKRSRGVEPAALPAPEQLVARDSRVDLAHEAKQIEENGWQGKSIPIDKDQIEDQNVLVRGRLTPSGESQTVLQLRLRPEADQALTKLLKRNATGAIEEFALQDSYWDSILAAVKTVNHHVGLGDTAFNDGTMKAAEALRPSLLQHKKAGNLVERKMAEQYLDVLDRLDAAQALARTGQVPSSLGMVREFKPAAADLKALEEALPRKKAKPLKVRSRKTWTEDRVRMDGPRLVLEEENALFSQLGGGISKGQEYHVDLGDGVRVVYKPYSGTTGYAMQGRMTVKVDAAVSEKTVALALEKLKKLGLDSSIASEMDEELMYLQKTAYVAKLDRTPAFQQAAAAAEGAGSPDEAVRIWRDAWSRQLGVDDVTRLPDYDPAGTFQMATAGKKGHVGGARIQHRFDLTQGMKRMDGYVLTHSTTSSGTSLEAFFDKVLGTNRAFMPTADRFATGVPIGGMSPVADLKSGGASYFFTRIRPRGEARTGTIRLKIDLLKRADAISYPNDKFGEVVGDVVRQHRGSTIAEFQRFARNVGNETIFKGPVTILDNLDHVSAGSASERQRIIAVFKKHGVTKLPDGRRIEDAIVVGQ